MLPSVISTSLGIFTIKHNSSSFEGLYKITSHILQSDGVKRFIFLDVLMVFNFSLSFTPKKTNIFTGLETINSIEYLITT